MREKSEYLKSENLFFAIVSREIEEKMENKLHSLTEKAEKKSLSRHQTWCLLKGRIKQRQQ